MNREVKILSTGSHVPERVVTNAEVDALLGESTSEWLVTNVGIRQRHWMAPDETTSDLITSASKKALDRAGLRAEDLDLIILSTDTPDYLSPSTSIVVQYKLGALLLVSATAALAGSMHALYQPIVSPNVASLGFTVSALLIILIGGVGTLKGALIGAAVYRLLDFGLRRYVGENASFISGAIYVAIVLFLPYGIVGTLALRSPQVKQGWKRMIEMLRK